uniref:Uncharacterized protein n=1 Tax=Macaca mulatta TaxID=9544 RepID=A0A5F7ZFD4_MACMU
MQTELPRPHREIPDIQSYCLLPGQSPAEIQIHDPLIQAQAKELTHLQQKIQERGGVCYLFTQHVKNTVKSFEGLLRNTGIAYYQRQRFCEQMVQGSQLTEILVRKLATGNLATGSEDP